MVKVAIKKLRCKKCDHEWTPRKSPVDRCPNCGTCKWNEDKAEAE